MATPKDNPIPIEVKPEGFLDKMTASISELIRKVEEINSSFEEINSSLEEINSRLSDIENKPSRRIKIVRRKNEN